MFEVSEYNPKELGYIVDPKTEEEAIAIQRAVKVIYVLQQEVKQLKEEKQGCEYCNTERNKFLTDDVYMATTNSYDDKDRVITSRDGVRYKTIRYCPMCGRKLME